MVDTCGTQYLRDFIDLPFLSIIGLLYPYPQVCKIALLRYGKIFVRKCHDVYERVDDSAFSDKLSYPLPGIRPVHHRHYHSIPADRRLQVFAHRFKGIILHADENVVLLAQLGCRHDAFRSRYDLSIVVAVQNYAVFSQRRQSFASGRNAHVRADSAEHPGHISAYPAGSDNRDLLISQFLHIMPLFLL